ncbi:hypothetical protein E2C01_087548 [Portunus trituberculatus]|uniref:Uncharacterized protein n=1 Tax=Portunus trituberculatus TaxID=210409 RepID=A0A5B7JHL4_PORTR|nr:hypothetical protein [Portunus trituberculatus]
MVVIAVIATVVILILEVVEVISAVVVVVVVVLMIAVQLTSGGDNDGRYAMVVGVVVVWGLEEGVAM